MDFGLSFIIALTDALVSNCCLGGATLIVINNMRYYLPGKEKYWYVLFVSIGLSTVWLLFIRIILWLFFKSDASYIQMLSQSSYIRFTISFLLIGCSTLVSLLWYTQQNENEAANKKQEIEQLAKDAELLKLRQQLQPHFLFNSLNSISALAGSNPEKARHMIQQLSDFLRGTLKKEEQQSILLKEEMEYVQLYLEIEKVRFGHRLQTVVNIEEKAAEKTIPAFILQPIVENAIKFGLYDTTEDVTIYIEGKLVNNQLALRVSNPFDETTAIGGRGTGFGLAYIQRRLFLLYERNDLLKTETIGHTFFCTITIPTNEI